MEIFNNITKTVKDDLQVTISPNCRVSIAAAFFSIYAFQELKEQLEDIQELRFIFTSPTFVIEKAIKQFSILALSVQELNKYGLILRG